MARPIQVTFDCADPDAQARFWAAALGYKQQDPPDGFDSWPEFLEAQGVPADRWNDFNAVVDPDGVGPRIFFQKVPEGKTVKNRVHLDVTVSGGRRASLDERKRQVDEAVPRLVALGATVVRVTEEPDEYYVVMLDPEGNEFCIQ